MKAYYIDESMTFKGHSKISINQEVYDEICADGSISGSFTLVATRLFGMPHDMFLKYIRQDFDAELHGKKGYIYYTFPNKLKAKELVEELNKRWNALQFLKEDREIIY